MTKRMMVLMALVASGCSEPLAPTDVAGQYALQRVNGVPLPVYYPGPADEPYRLLSARVVLAADGSAETVDRVERVFGALADTVETVREWQYTIDGSHLRLRNPPCEDVCAAVLMTADFTIAGDVLISRGGQTYHRMDLPAP
jgi:hypothetical protein